MLIKFNSGHDQEAKSSNKMVQVQVSRPLRILESGEITFLSPFQKADKVTHCPNTLQRLRELLRNDCSDSCNNSERSLIIPSCISLFSRRYFYGNYCCVFLLAFFQKWPFRRFSELCGHHSNFKN